MYGCIMMPFKAKSVYPIGINSKSPVICFKQYLSSALNEYSNTNLKAIFTVLTPHTWWMNSCLPQVFSSTDLLRQTSWVWYWVLKQTRPNFQVELLSWQVLSSLPKQNLRKQLCCAAWWKIICTRVCRQQSRPAVQCISALAPHSSNLFGLTTLTCKDVLPCQLKGEWCLKWGAV